MTAAGVFAAGREFVYRDARLLERRVFASLFERASTEGAVDALRGYRNDDGGFGHALEPDKRCPDNQPLDVEFALETLATVGARDDAMVAPACDYLASVADEEGAVPVVTPAVAAYPRAEHWGDGRFPPGLNPTVGIVGLLFQLRVDDPWRERAAAYCWRELEHRPPADAHVVRGALRFLEHAPDRERAEELIPRVGAKLRSAAHFRSDPRDRAYGLSPLEFAPTPTSRWEALFAADEIDAHLQRLVDDQADDGGWPLDWEPPSQGARLEWRGWKTVQALRVLTAYGVVSAADGPSGAARRVQGRA